MGTQIHDLQDEIFPNTRKTREQEHAGDELPGLLWKTVVTVSKGTSRKWGNVSSRYDLFLLISCNISYPCCVSTQGINSQPVCTISCPRYTGCSQNGSLLRAVYSNNVIRFTLSHELQAFRLLSAAAVHVLFCDMCSR